MVKNRLYITKASGITPAEYEQWPYYEYEYLIEDIKEYNEEEKKRSEQESQVPKFNDSSIKSTLNSMMKQNPMGYKIPKAPKL